MIVTKEGKIIAPNDWLVVSGQENEISGVAAIKSITGIVMTQDCDVVRIDDIALCEVAEFSAVVPNSAKPKTAKSVVSFITTQSRQNLKWFYLPADERIGFPTRMAADFHAVVPTSREYLETNLGKLRIGRLNTEAGEHFRERLSDYFRRYPYDEWYPFNKEEFDAYRETHPDSEPRPWQAD